MGTIAGVEDLLGGSAADTITGNDLDNRIMGRGGADTIVGRNGNDVLIGDSAQITTLSGVITSIRLTTSAKAMIRLQPQRQQHRAGWPRQRHHHDWNGNNVIAGDLVLVTLSGGVVTSIQTLNSASDGNDIINLGSGNDSVVAGAGNDSIQDSGGRNVIIGDRGTIEFINGLPVRARSSISVLSGSDTITTGSGNDAIIGGGHADPNYGWGW